MAPKPDPEVPLPTREQLEAFCSEAARTNRVIALRVRELEQIVLELIPYVEETHTRFTGGLFGAGGGAVLRAKAAMLIPRVATFTRRLAGPRPFNAGDQIELDGWLLEVRKIARKGRVQMVVVGRKEP